MSTDIKEKFARACNQIEGGRIHQISVSYLHPPGSSPKLMIRNNDGRVVSGSYIQNFRVDFTDSEMNADLWRQYGKSIKISNEVKQFDFLGQEQEVSPEATQCLQAFFEELKENTSIEKFGINNITLGTAISALDLRYFFQNNNTLRDTTIVIGQQVTQAQSAKIATALRDVSMNMVFIRGYARGGRLGGFFHNEAFKQIISACQRVGLLGCTLEANDHFASVAEFLRDPSSLIEMMALSRVRVRDNSRNVDVERAENELVAGLNQNSNLKVLQVSDLFEKDTARGYIKFHNLLCDTTSIASVCQSNHTLEEIHLHREKLPACEEYLELNKISNKRKVVQCKLMKYFFSQSTNPIRPLANMPLGLLTEVLGIDVPEKQSAVFNILKYIPELCDVSSRSAFQLQESCDADSAPDKKRQKNMK